MRINLYREELTKEVLCFERTSDTGVTYTGLRLFLKSPDALHHNVFDDDRSAITFFVRTPEEKRYLAETFFAMANAMVSTLTPTTPAKENTSG
jgi:hypothetical protein